MFNISKFSKEISVLKKLGKNQNSLTLEQQSRIKSNILKSIATESITVKEKSFWDLHSIRVYQFTSVLLLGVFLFGGTAYASNSSLPGDVLYPLKRLQEKIQVNLAVTEEGKVDLQSKFAQRRLVELALLRRKNVNLVKINNATLNPSASTTPAILENESEVEVNARLEALKEVREAVVNLKKAQLKLVENGDNVKAKKVLESISNLESGEKEINLKLELRKEIKEKIKERVNEKIEEKKLEDESNEDPDSNSSTPRERIKNFIKNRR